MGSLCLFFCQKNMNFVSKLPLHKFEATVEVTLKNFLILVFSCKNIEKIEIETLKILEMDSENVKNTMALILNFKSVN